MIRVGVSSFVLFCLDLEVTEPKVILKIQMGVHISLDGESIIQPQKVPATMKQDQNLFMLGLKPNKVSIMKD